MKTIIIDGIEYNLTPKVLFKKGDWVVYCNEDVDLITGIEENGYCINNGGYIPFVCASDIRLWTIQDAKAGDLLTDDYGIYIFDRFDEYDEKCFLCMGAYQHSQKVFENEHLLCCVEVHPATKEQRDLLFQKMKEAGYGWDAENKQLKKIEQKPAWSEEDEVMIKIFDSIIRYIVEVVDKDVLERFGTKREELFSWLKSLKDRVQPKQEWSEEEEENFKKAIRVLKVNNFHHTADMLQEMKHKLIPREKANWKPSDEQIMAVNTAINVLGKGTLNGKQLIELQEQLKKLRDE